MAKTRRMTELKRIRELQRCLKSSWYLATEYLEYGWMQKGEEKGLVERVHKPIMDWYDRHRHTPRFGLWMARRRHKTTLVITWLIQEIMEDPSKSHRYWHDSNDLATEVIREVGSHFQYNDKLRELDPIGRDPKQPHIWHKCFPSKRATRWIKYGKGDATLRLNVPWLMFGAGTRSATLRAQGVNSAVTGAHINGTAWLDDIISEDTIKNSRLQAVADFYRHTVVPVVDSMRFRCTGTPWSDWSLYQEWMRDPRWHTIVIPGAISESDEEYQAAFKKEAA